MADKPIIYSSENIIALIDGRKTQTRRTSGLEKINENPDGWEIFSHYPDGCWMFYEIHTNTFETVKPRFQVGDTFWVKETCYILTVGGSDESGEWKSHELQIPKFVRYFATDGKIDEGWRTEDNCYFCLPKRSSLFMPRWASRISGKITGVRCQRVQDITVDDAKAEGVDQY